MECIPKYLKVDRYRLGTRWFEENCSSMCEQGCDAKGRLEWINAFVASFTFMGPTSPFACHLPGRETSATELARRGFLFSVLSAWLCSLVFAPVFLILNHSCS